jgi:hypothetical protein
MFLDSPLPFAQRLPFSTRRYALAKPLAEKGEVLMVRSQLTITGSY